MDKSSDIDRIARIHRSMQYYAKDVVGRGMDKLCCREEYDEARDIELLYRTAVRFTVKKGLATMEDVQFILDDYDNTSIRECGEYFKFVVRNGLDAGFEEDSDQESN